MASTSISISDTDAEPTVAVLQIGERDVLCGGGRFMSIHFGDGVSVILPGFNADQVRYARALVAALTVAADEIESATREAVTT